MFKLKALGYLGLAVSLLVGCNVETLKQVAATVNTGSAVSTDITKSIPALPSQTLTGFGSPDNRLDDLSGASATDQSQFNSQSINPGWNTDRYLLMAVDSSKPVQLEYQSASGGPAVPTILVWNNGWTNIGFQYNPNDASRYNAAVSIPANTRYVAAVFYGLKPATINAKISQTLSPGISLTNLDSPHEPTLPDSPGTLIASAVQRSGGKLGTAKSELTRATTVTAWKQEFTNGLVVLEDGDNQAFAIYGDIWPKYSRDGNTSRFGLPVSDIETGITLNGKPSVYQMYDKPGSPSLHSSALGTYLFLGGIRDNWQKYREQLGHPTSDEINGVQNFERGKIEWNNGNPRITVNGQVVAGSPVGGNDSSCWAYPVGNPPGTGKSFNNSANAFQYQYKGKFHLGDDWNGNGGGNTDNGEPVYAIGNGVVLEAKNLGKGWGNGVFVKHVLKGKDYTALYAHLKDIQVKKDQVLTTRQQLGTIGRGYNNEYIAHLHLELREGINLRPGPGYSKSKITVGPQQQINPQALIDQNRCK